jgi:hypothetical protein
MFSFVFLQFVALIFVGQYFGFGFHQWLVPWWMRSVE